MREETLNVVDWSEPEEATGLCPYCAYEVGESSDRCSECGGVVPIGRPERARLIRSIRQERSAWRVGFFGFGVSVVLVLLGIALGAALRSTYGNRPSTGPDWRTVLQTAWAAPWLVGLFACLRMRGSVRHRAARRLGRGGAVRSRWQMWAVVIAVAAWLWPALVVAVLWVGLAD